MLDFLLRAFLLKDEARAGWVIRGIREPESVADHSWGTALLCLLAGPTAGVEVDVDRAVRMALVHDLAEALTHDIPAGPGPRAIGAAEKHRLEGEAITKLCADLPEDQAADVRALWEEYEQRVTPTALFVRDMNLVDMVAQALVYEEGRRYDRGLERLDEFFETAAPRLSSEEGQRLFAEVRARYEAARRSA